MFNNPFGYVFYSMIVLALCLMSAVGASIWNDDYWQVELAARNVAHYNLDHSWHWNQYDR